MGLFNDMRQYINKDCWLPVLYTLSLATCVHNMHVSPLLIYIAMDCIMRYAFSLHVFSQDQILINPKSYGLVHNVFVKKISVCCTVFADALI